MHRPGESRPIVVEFFPRPIGPGALWVIGHHQVCPSRRRAIGPAPRPTDRTVILGSRVHQVGGGIKGSDSPTAKFTDSKENIMFLRSRISRTVALAGAARYCGRLALAAPTSAMRPRFRAASAVW